MEKTFNLSCPHCGGRVMLICVTLGEGIVIRWRCDQCQIFGKNTISYTDVFNDVKPN